MRDVHEWLAERLDQPAGRPPRTPVIVQDPCHLRHVQRAHLAGAGRPRPRRRRRRARRRRALLRRRRCLLGAAAGARPARSASASWRRSTGGRRRSGATVVASANPGCAMHLAAGRRASPCAIRSTSSPRRWREQHSSRRPARGTPCRGPRRASPSRCSIEAVADGGPSSQRPSRQDVTQARRAVEKAATSSPRRRRWTAADASHSDEADEGVDGVDQGAQVAVAVLGERRSGCGQLDVVVVAPLDVQRLGALDRAPRDEVAEALVELGELLVRRTVAQADDQVVADVADRVVVAVEAVDLGGRLLASR